MRQARIDTLNTPEYRLACPIPVDLYDSEDGEVTAEFRDANVGMTGLDTQDALEILADVIISVFELYEEKTDSLGPEPQIELMILRQYIERT